MSSGNTYGGAYPHQLGTLRNHRDMSYLGFAVTLNHNSQCQEVKQREDVLCSLDIAPLIRKTVQLLVDPDMRAGIHKGPCATDNLFIISFSFQIDPDLLHVRRPVNFGVYQTLALPGCRTRVLVMARTGNFVDDDAAERCICNDE